jgi:hypothetical protein
MDHRVETCELVMALDAIVAPTRHDPFAGVQFLRHEDGLVLDRYELRGRSLRRVRASTAEQPTWNSAAVVLAANALGGDGPTAGLFRGVGLPAGLTAEELIAAGAEIEATRRPGR